MIINCIYLHTTIFIHRWTDDTTPVSARTGEATQLPDLQLLLANCICPQTWGINVNDFLDVLLSEPGPDCLTWLPLLHRLAQSETGEVAWLVCQVYRRGITGAGLLWYRETRLGWRKTHLKLVMTKLRLTKVNLRRYKDNTDGTKTQLRCYKDV